MENNKLDVFTRSYVLNVLENINARPLRRLGQNFLIDKNIFSKIRSFIPDNLLTIEIGPGLGIMLPEKNKKEKYIGIEIDKKLSEFLKSKGFNILNMDFLKVDLKELVNEDCIIIGNLPYYITTDIILHIIRNISFKIKELYFLVQKDFAKKLKNYKIKTASLVLIRDYFEISHLFDISANCFYPKPRIESSLIKMTNKGLDYDRDYEDFLKKLFRHKRKFIYSFFKSENLKDSYPDHYKKRIETVDDFYNLYKILKQKFLP